MPAETGIIYSIMVSSLSVTQTPEALQLVPPALELKLLNHRLSAGFPSPAADYSEDGLDLNHYLVQHKSATYMFTVKGDSMIGACIVEGDKVVVDCSLRPRHNDIVVAVVEGEYTIKRLYKYRGRHELRPENPAYQPILFQEGSQLEVWGVVVGVVRRYSPRA
jgi:DNA polymerase V